VLFVLFSAATLLSAATGYKILTRYPVPGAGGWDYISIDSAARRLYVSHETQVDVLDADSGRLVGTIPDTPGVHGVALAPKFHHGFSSNGREDKVSMFDPATLQLIRKIDVGKGPDGIYYHPATHRVFTNNHGSHDVTAIDASSGQVVGTVDLKGDGEQAIIAADGLIYVNAEDTDEIVAFDPASLTVKKRYPIGVAKGPTGLAYDAQTNRLFTGCHEPAIMVAMDAATGKVVGQMPIGKGVDFAGSDPDARLVFFSCGEGVLSIFHIDSADNYSDAGAVKTQPSARTMAFDPRTKQIFLPAAEYDETPAADPTKRPRRSVKPGTFAILVVGK
jgi:DNA-binding beta-propeller fold protein YncE